jgi:Na+/proline symporter
LILEHTPMAAQIVFFGAVLSAVMSCSSATLLAPSVALSENVLKQAIPRLNDSEFLRMMRVVLVLFAGTVLAIALWSDASIYKLVVNTYKVTLVVAFIPLLAGLYWQNATSQGAVTAVVSGLATWLVLELVDSPEAVWPPQLVGLLAAAAGMVIGSLLPAMIGKAPIPPQLPTG